MSEPCPCWRDNYSHSPEPHCCFRGESTEYQLGQAPPCGHWPSDVPRPNLAEGLW
jgi:hypothetical protein